MISGPQQRDDVGADGELEAGKHFFGDRGAAEHVAAFEHQHFLARARQISSVDQSVMSATNDDDVVFIAHSLTLGYWGHSQYIGPPHQGIYSPQLQSYR